MTGAKGHFQKQVPFRSCLDLELDADGSQGSLSTTPQVVRKAISLNLTKKTKMKAKSSTKSTKSKKDRRDHKEG